MPGADELSSTSAGRSERERVAQRLGSQRRQLGREHVDREEEQDAERRAPELPAERAHEQEHRESAALSIATTVTTCAAASVFGAADERETVDVAGVKPGYASRKPTQRPHSYDQSGVPPAATVWRTRFQ